MPCRLAIIGEMKTFVGLAKDRLAGLSVTPTVGLSRHVRTLCLLGFILCSNALGLALLHRHQGALSWAISLLFALDLGIISVEATKAALRWVRDCTAACFGGRGLSSSMRVHSSNAAMRILSVWRLPRQHLGGCRRRSSCANKQAYSHNHSAVAAPPMPMACSVNTVCILSSELGHTLHHFEAALP